MNDKDFTKFEKATIDQLKLVNRCLLKRIEYHVKLIELFNLKLDEVDYQGEKHLLLHFKGYFTDISHDGLDLKEAIRILDRTMMNREIIEQYYDFIEEHRDMDKEGKNND